MTKKHRKLETTRIDPPEPTGILVHALHKSGSMFLYQLLFRLCRARRIRFYSCNHPQPDELLVHPSMAYDFCLGPIRDFELPVAFDGTQILRRIYHVRDPRDLLVSQYFSYGWNHSSKQFDSDQTEQRSLIRSMSIDEYVLSEHLSVRAMKNRLVPLVQQIRSHSVSSTGSSYSLAIVTYEEMVCDFQRYLKRVIEAFSFRFPTAAATRFAFRYRNEFRPDNTRFSHKRAVAPGDHRRQLKTSTIERLNTIFSDELIALGYLSERQKTFGESKAA